MRYAHVFEVLPGEVIFRRSGNGVLRFKRCRQVKTRVLSVQKLDGGQVLAQISVLVTGYEHVLLPTWFADWEDSDCLNPGLDGDFQTGKAVVIAVGEDELEEMLATGAPITTEIVYSDPSTRDSEPFSAPVVAVLIDGRWVEPLSSVGRQA